MALISSKEQHRAVPCCALFHNDDTETPLPLRTGVEAETIQQLTIRNATG
jgi:hypothetical protein